MNLSCLIYESRNLKRYNNNSYTAILLHDNYSLSKPIRFLYKHKGMICDHILIIIF